MSMQNDIQRLRDQLDLGYFGEIDGGAINRVCDALENAEARLSKQGIKNFEQMNKDYYIVCNERDEARAQLTQAHEALREARIALEACVEDPRGYTGGRPQKWLDKYK